jgi:phosphate transport system substrate-binding protein
MKKILITLLLLLPAVITQAQVIKLDGSSTVFPISEAVAEDFQNSTKFKVTVGISGTGGGFKKFCRGEIDISDASRPILKSEMEVCKAAGIQYYELPIAYDALTVVVSSKNTWLNSITIEELKKIWEPAAQAKITNWKQVNPAYPNAPMKLYGPGADSGTFDYFTEAVVGKAKSSRGDFTASEDDNVLVQGVSQDTNALGYFGFSYFDANRDRLKALPIITKAGAKAISPSVETVMDGSYQPFSRPLFIYVNIKSYEKPEIKRFVEFYMKNGPRLIAEVKYVPLPAHAYEYNLTHIESKKYGTKFGGENKVGLTIEQLMKMETKE